MNYEDYKFKKGDKVSGPIKSITDFGIFIGLDGGIDGLVHLSDISWHDTGEEAVRNFRFTWEERVFRLGASIGVVPITADNEDVAGIVSAADSACAALPPKPRATTLKSPALKPA